MIIDIPNASTDALNRAFDIGQRAIALHNDQIDRHGSSPFTLAVYAHRASAVCRSISKELDARGELPSFDEILAELDA